jgi:NADH-quinone oxidoreductase subunit E
MLTDEEKREIEAQAAHFEDRRAAAIDALRIVQRRRGWVPDEVIRPLAEFLKMAPVELDGVASFYNEIFRRPVGRHVIQVCDSVSCWIVGTENVLESLIERLGIGLGGTTDDGRFTLLPIICIGACDHAPAMMIDEDLHTDIDAGAIDEILDRYA